MKGFKFLPYALLVYFLLPYILFFRFFNLNFQIDYQELFWAFKNSFVQSFSAATLITLAAIPLSLGLFQFHGKAYQFLMKLLLLPQILPTFFSILIAFSIWKPFPLGSIGISFIFLLVHLGFGVVLVHTATIEKLGSYSVVSEVFGLSRFRFFKTVYFPSIRNELLVCFLMIFIFCFSSFSIPLIASGGKDTTVEVLVFEKIFINQNWSVAWTISVLQNLFLTAISLLLFRKSQTTKREFMFSNYLTSSVGVVGLVVYLFIYVMGYLLGLFQSLPSLSMMQLFSNEILDATLVSLKLLLLYLVVCFALLYLWLYDFVQNHKLNFSQHLISASTVLVGFAFYLFFPQTQQADLFKIPIAMSILFFPMLFKSFLEKSVLSLNDQVLVAQIYGISAHEIIWQIILRRIRQPLLVWFSFMTIWFLSDFATLRALGTQSPTLGLLAGSFLSSYRLPMAYLMSFYILVIWSLVLLASYLVLEVWRVADKKFKI